MKDKYIGWEDEADMLSEFGITPDAIEGYNVIVACYEAFDYGGEAFVLLKKDDNYYEVNGSHCSCYGLEGQWDLEDSSEAALKIRVNVEDAYGAFKKSATRIKNHFQW